MNSISQKRLKVLRRRLLQKRFSTLNKIALFATTLFSIFQLLCYFTPFVSPEFFWPFAFLGLAYPFIFLINVLFIFYWIIQWKRFFIIPLSVLLAGIYYVGSFLQVNYTKPLPDKKIIASNDELIKIMSYNVRVFDLYNWSKNKETRNEIFDLLKEEDPDIICFQEFYRDASLKFKTHDTLITFLLAKNAHIQITKQLHGKDEWGIATYTRYPIVNKGFISFGNRANNICIYTDLLIAGDTIRVYNLHMQSVHFGYKDYRFIDDLKNNRETNEIEGGIRIFTRLKKAYIKRAQQADKVAQHIAQCHYPILLCGDFNDTPISYTYRTIKGQLVDSYREAGNGFGRTFSEKFVPYRIDYILHSRHFKTLNYQVLPDELSDHYPLVAYLQKKQ